jgi:hypothetical protein
MAEAWLPQIYAAEHAHKKLYQEAAEHGFKMLEAADKGAETKTNKRARLWREWQTKAEGIWRKDPKQTKRSIAANIAKETGENIETIRQHSKKLN